MPKLLEISYEDRLKIVKLRENSFSYPNIGRLVGCHHSTALPIWKNLEKLCKKFARKRVTVWVQFCKEVVFQFFEDLREAIAKAVGNSPQKQLVRRALHRNGLKSYR